MDIAGLVIRARPAGLGAVSERLVRLPGVEVAGACAEGRLVITVEDRPGASFEQTLLAIHQVEGVLCATLVYQYSDAIPHELEARP